MFRKAGELYNRCAHGKSNLSKSRKKIAGKRVESLEDRRMLTGYADDVLALNPSLYYQFNETSGSTVAENFGSLGAQGDGSILNGLVIDQGGYDPNSNSQGFGRAYLWNNDNQQVITNAATTAEIGFGDDFTAVAWWNRNETGGGDRFIFGNPQAGGNSTLHLGVRDSRGHMGFWGNDTGGGSNEPPYTTQGEWHFSAFVFDTNGGFQRIYTDGQLTDERGGAAPFNNTGNPLQIGATDNNNNGRRWQGLLDEIAVFDRVLTAQEIQDLYNSASFNAANDAATINGPVTLDVLANDNIPNNPLDTAIREVDGQSINPGQTITLSGGQGTVTLENTGELTYNPGGFTGQASFTYFIETTVAVGNPPQIRSDTGNVSVFVLAPGSFLWDGASDGDGNGTDFSDPNNWANDSVPGPGDTAVFGDLAPANVVTAGQSVSAILMTNSTATFSFSGTGLSANSLSQVGGGSSTFNAELTLTDLSVDAGTLTVNNVDNTISGGVTLTGGTLSVALDAATAAGALGTADIDIQGGTLETHAVPINPAILALDAYAYDVSTGGNGDDQLDNIGDGTGNGGLLGRPGDIVSHILIDGTDRIHYENDDDFNTGDAGLSAQGFRNSLDGLPGLNQIDNFATRFEGYVNIPNLNGDGSPINVEFGTNRADDPVNIYVDLDGDGIFENGAAEGATNGNERVIDRGCCGNAYNTISIAPGSYRYMAAQLERGGGSQIEPTFNLGLGRQTVSPGTMNGLFTNVQLPAASLDPATLPNNVNVNGNATVAVDGSLVGLNIGGALSIADSTSLAATSIGQAVFASGTTTLGASSVVAPEAPAAVVFTGQVTGDDLVVEGTGEVVLANSTNNYSGDTIVNGGNLVVVVDDALGSTAVGTTITSGNLIFDGAFDYNGSEAYTASGGTITNRNGDTSVAGDITLTGNANIGAQADTLTVAGGVALGTNTLTINGNGTTVVDGVVSGDGQVVKNGTGTGTLNGTNTFTGQVDVSNGILAITNDDSLGAAAGGTNVNGGSLRLDGVFNETDEELTIVGTGFNNMGALSNASGDSTISSPVVVAGAVSIGSEEDSLIIDSDLALGSANLTLTGAAAGTVVINGVISDDSVNGFIPGLRETVYDQLFLDGTNGIILNSEVFLDVRGGASNFGGGTVDGGASGPWTFDGDNETIIYSGQIFDADGEFALAENIDDQVKITIDGVEVLRNTGWNVPTTTADATNNAAPGAGTLDFGMGPAGDGWHDIEIIMNNGGGGAGAVGGNGWSGTYAFGLNSNPGAGFTSADGADYGGSVPADPGDGSLFRTFGSQVIKVGDSTAILNGDNTFGGNAEINAGTLVAGHDNALGTSTFPVDVANGGALGFINNVTIDESINVDGTGPANRSGAIVNLSGDNTYNGTLNVDQVSQGQVGIGSDGGTLTVDSDVNLQFSSLLLDGAGNVVINGVISGNGADVITPNVLEGFAFNVTGANGDETLGNIGDGTGSGGLLGMTPVSQILIDGDDRIHYENDGDFNNGNAGNNAEAMNIGQNDNFATMFIGYINIPDLNFGAPYDVEFGTRRADDPVQIYVDLNQNGIFEHGQGANFNPGGVSGPFGEMILNRDCCGDGYRNVSIAPGTYRYAAVQLERGGGSQIEPTIDLFDGNLRRTVQPGQMNGLFSIGTFSNNAVVKQGTGTATLTAANTYNEGTTVSEGVLAAGHANALGDLSQSVEVQDGGSLGLTGGITLGNYTVEVNGLGAAGHPGAIVNLAGDNTIPAGTTLIAATVSEGDFSIGSEADTLTVDTDILMQHSALTVDGDGDVVINGVISGLPNAVTTVDYSSGFSGAGGDFTILGTSAALVGNVIQITDNTNGQLGVAWLNQRVPVSGGIFEAEFTLDFRAPNAGGADGIGFVIQNDPAGTALATPSAQGAEHGPPANAITITFDSWDGGPPNSQLEIVQAGTTTHTFDLASNGFPDLSGNGPYSARVVLQDGLLSVFADLNQNGFDAGDLVFDSIPVDLEALNAVDANGEAIIGFSGRTGGANEFHEVLDLTLDYTRISDNSVHKEGTGNLTLSAANAYIGDTTINGVLVGGNDPEGAIIVTNTTGSATGAGNVFVDNWGSFAGTGSINGWVQTGLTGMVEVGPDLGESPIVASTLTVGSADINGFAIFDITDTGNDTLAVSSGGMVMLDMDFLDTAGDNSFLFVYVEDGSARPTNGQEFTLIDNQSAPANLIAGTFIDPNFGAAGFPPLPAGDTSAELAEGDFFQVKYDADPAPDNVPNAGDGIDLRYRMFSISYVGGDGNDLVITHVNRAPVGVDDTINAPDSIEDVPVTSDFVANDPDNDPITAPTITDDVDDGTLVDNGDGTFTYTPDPFFSGTDAFNFLANDGELPSPTEATITINVAPVANDPTFSVPATLNAMEDVAINLGITAASVDTDGSEQLDVTIAGIPVGATIDWNDGAAQSFTATAGNTSLTLVDTDQAVLDTVTVTGALNDATDFTLSVTATITDSVTFDDATTATDTVTTAPLTIFMEVVPVVDGATPSAGTVTGTENTVIDLQLGGGSSDPDEVITLVTVSDVPADAVLTDSAGNPYTEVSPGTYEFTDPALLTGLSIIKEDGDVPFTAVTLQVSFEATDVDPDNGNMVSLTSPQIPLNVEVANTPPNATITFTGSGQTVTGFPTPFDVTANDANPNDDPFTYTVDWGDGSPIETFDNRTAFESLTHPFANFGTITVTVTATDADGETGAPASTTIEVVPVAVIDGDIYAGGTGNSDTIIYYPSNAGVRVRYNTSFFGPFPVQADTQLLAFGQGGNDRIIVAGDIGVPAVFDGGVGNDYLAGLDTDDTLIGGGGNDILLGGEGNNLFIGDDRPDDDPSDDAMPGSDRIEGRSGIDYAFGGGGNDRINGGGGDDVLDGGLGNDYLFGGLGNDFLYGGGGSDVINGHFGNDVIFGGADSDQIFGSNDHDLIVAGTGRDRVRGDAGDDDIVGGTSSIDTQIEAALDAILAGTVEPDLATADPAVDLALQMWFMGQSRAGFGGFTSDGVSEDLAGGSGSDEVHAGDGLRDFRIGEDSTF